MYPRNISPYQSVNITDKRVAFYDSRLFHVWMYIRSFSNTELRQFFKYLDLMAKEFERIRLGLDYSNEEATHHNGDDRHAAGWAGAGMLPIAAYLYYLKSYGVTGKVLECGVFKGGSTCCLSHACNYLGIELVAADSYDGLPAGDQYYGKGDFRGGLEEVQHNIKRYGKPDSVTYLKGWFSESLKNFNDDIMLLWLDVDLKSSVLEVLDCVYPYLVENGVIFCDGLGEWRDFTEDSLIAGSSESAGVLEYFTRHNIAHKAVYSGFGHMGLVVPKVASSEQVIYNKVMMDRILFIRHKLRRRVKRITQPFVNRS